MTEPDDVYIKDLEAWEDTYWVWLRVCFDVLEEAVMRICGPLETNSSELSAALQLFLLHLDFSLPLAPQLWPRLLRV